MIKLTQVKTSDGWFNVEYGKYYPSLAATRYEPGEQADVDIIDVSFVDPEEDYENTIEGYMEMDCFVDELKEKVIEDITR